MKTELRRLAALHDLQVLDTPPEERFNRIARIAAHVFGCPKAAIGLIDEKRLWFKAVVGSTAAEVPRELTFCNHAIESDAPLVVGDALADSRPRLHALAKESHTRFYVGQAVHAPDGSRVGAICAWDSQPHAVDSAQLAVLKDLVAQVESELYRQELVLAQRQLEESEQRLSLAWDASGQGFWDWSIGDNRVAVSGSLHAMLGFDAGALNGDVGSLLALVHPDDHDRFMRAARQLAAGEINVFEGEFRLRCKSGGYRWMLSRSKTIRVGAHPARVVGALSDIHLRKLAEDERLRQAERMALALRAGGVGTFELDVESGGVVWDDRVYELLGLSDGGGQPSTEAVFRVCHPGDRHKLRAVQRRLVGGKYEALDAEFRVVWPGGEVRYLRLLGKVLKGLESSSRVLIGTCWDVTQARQLQSQLSHQASHDALTGLPNRREFERRLQEALQSARRYGHVHAVCSIDLDRFKMVNDTAGHAAGDSLLRELGQVLAHQVRAGDVLARLGGDEFGLLLLGCSIEQAEQVAAKLLTTITGYGFHWDGRPYSVGASIGIACLHAETASTAEAMSEADVACYAAKAAGRGRVSVYRAGHSEARQYHRELLLAAGIREALSANRFCLYAQKIVATDGVCNGGHYELLVRMLGLDGELIPPGAFIPAAERYGLMAEIDRWVFREALERQGPRIAALPDVAISINLSANSLDDPAFACFVQELIERSPLPPQRIHLEITETALMNQISAASKLISMLRQLGCKVMLDDFGAGVSSFSYLKHFPVDYVKIDGSFVRTLRESAVDRVIVESIHEVARKLGARTVAEFVEDDATLALLQEMGIDFAQGYGIAKPRPLQVVLDELAGLDC